VDHLGNIVVTGYSLDSDSYYDYATVKYNAAGTPLWVARYGLADAHDQPSALAVNEVGNAYVTGTSRGFDTSWDFATVKYSAAGVEQWVARYNGSSNRSDEAYAIAVDAAGNVYVTGMSQGAGLDNDYATVKYDAVGTEQWIARYNGPGNGDDWANALAVDGTGNVYVTGRSQGLDSDDDYATIKYDAAGKEQWVARYNGPGNSSDRPSALAVDAAGNAYVTGGSIGSGTIVDYATVKYDSAGKELWVARYNGPGEIIGDRAIDLGLDTAKNVYVTGRSTSPGPGDDWVTVKYDSSGLELWVARYNGPADDNDVPTALVVDGTGNAYVSGYSIAAESSLESSYDYTTVKYDATGAEQWVARYDGPGDNSWANALAVDANGNVYVTGEDAGTAWSVFTTIKYVQLSVAVEQKQAAVPVEFSLSQNYPNPFNPSTTIEFALPQASFVNLKIYDLLGKEVATLVSEKLPAGKHQRVWDAKGLASGVYLYRLETGNFIQTKKLILLR
jgi:hypothetical protein